MTNPQTELFQALMRRIFNKNDFVLELGAGTGETSKWLNETGWYVNLLLPI